MRAGMTINQVMALGDAAVTPWRDFESTVSTFDAVATVRILMASALLVTPHADRDGARGHAASFTRSGSAAELIEYRGHSVFTNFDMWLRLAPLGLHLNTIADTEQIDLQSQHVTARRTSTPIWFSCTERDGGAPPEGGRSPFPA